MLFYFMFTFLNKYVTVPSGLNRNQNFINDYKKSKFKDKLPPL